MWWGLQVVGGLLGLLIALLTFSVINQRIGLTRDWGRFERAWQATLPQAA